VTPSGRRLALLSRPPGSPSSTSLPHDRRLSPNSQVPPRCAPIPPAEDMRIAQDTSADAIHMRQLRKSRHLTSDTSCTGLDHISVGRNFTVDRNRSSPHSYSYAPLFSFCLRLPALHFTLSLSTLVPFPLVIVTARPHSPSLSRFPPSLSPKLTSRVALVFTRVPRPKSTQ